MRSNRAVSMLMVAILLWGLMLPGCGKLEEEKFGSWDMPSPIRTGIDPTVGIFHLKSAISNDVMNVSMIEVSLVDGQKYVRLIGQYYDPLIPVIDGGFYYEEGKIAPGVGHFPKEGYAISGYFTGDTIAVGTLKLAIYGHITTDGKFVAQLQLHGIIMGFIYDGRAPLVDVLVTVVGANNITTTTNSSGSFTLYSVPAGDQTLRISKTGYNSVYMPVFVIANGVVDCPATYLTTSCPQLDSIDPNSGAVGTQVTLSGLGFGTTQGTSAVIFPNDVNADSISAWTDTMVVCQVPTSAQTGNVTVANSMGTSSGVTFTVTTY